MKVFAQISERKGQWKQPFYVPFELVQFEITKFSIKEIRKSSPAIKENAEEHIKLHVVF